MTLLALLHIDGVPTLIGDILISGNVPENQKFSLPTIDDINRIPPSDYGLGILDTKQKINVLGDNLIVGWAGSEIAARTIIRELKQKNDSSPLDRKDLDQLFDEIDRNPNDWIGSLNVAFITLLSDSEGVYSCSNAFNCHIIKFETEKYGDVFLGGTGSAHMQDLLLNLERYTSSKTSSYSSFDNAIIEALSITSWLFLQEYGTAENLRQLYGGSYEIGTYIGGKPQKLGSVTYLYWSLQTSNGSSSISLVQNGFQVAYVDNNLLVHRFEVQCIASNLILSDPSWIEFQIIDEKGYYAPPVFKEPSPDEPILIPGLNSQFMCNQVLVLDGANLLTIASVPSKILDHSHSPIVFLQKDDTRVLAVKDCFLQELAKIGQRAADSTASSLSSVQYQPPNNLLGAD